MNEQELQLLHETSVKILSEIGVRLEHDDIVERMVKAGATLGPGANEVRFPRKMIDEYLAMVPDSVELADRSGGTAVLTAQGPSAFWTNPALNIRRGDNVATITTKDLASIARLCDNLPNINGVIGTAMGDLASKHCDFTGVRIIAENCRKHIRALCFSGQGMEALKEMKEVFPGNWLSVGFTAHGPLRWTNLALDVFLKSAGSGIPATINGEPMAGVTGPVSIAGSVAVGNAEILSGIVVNQVLEPGRPMIYNLGLAHVFDMKYSTAVTGGPENALFAVASAELGRFYNIPSSSWASTDAVFEDGQAAFEKMFGIHTHSINRVSLIWGLGQLESEKTISLAQLVIDDELIDYARQYERGFVVNEDTLQYELIKQVGIGGSFLDTEHTLMNFRQHLWFPKLINRNPRGVCEDRLEQRALNYADQILAEDQEEKISRHELDELKKIEQRYREKIIS